MPSPNPQRTMEDLEKMHKMKQDLERLEQVRDEFIREAKKVRQEEKFLVEISKEKEDLERDKMILTEEMKAVNSDINKLDDAAKQSETERKIAEEKAKRLYSEMIKIKTNVNIPRAEFQLELLPANLADPEDEARFQTFLVPPHSWPVSAESYRQMAFVPPTTEDYHRVEMAMFANVATATASAVVQESSNAAHAFGKQAPPPMKTCNACQSQIHRNAPICPLCKSKSRSRNPKKPKQRRPDDHN